ncbi:MAG: transglycosylase domain-containing protein, partial [Planktomarina sp.]
GKIRQMRLALAMERVLSKDQILDLYLNLAPFGGNIEGVRAASLAYFDRPPNRLTAAQAALLVALPQSPERRRPDRFALQAAAARDRVAAQLAQAGTIDPPTLTRIQTTGVRQVRHSFPAVAPHLADRAIAQGGGMHLTVDYDIQKTLEELAAQAVAGRSDGVQVAMVAVDWQVGHVLASVGSSGYDTTTRAGFLDLTRAVRSPGSTLKPLVYGLGFDAGIIHPDTMIDDRLTDFAGYQPQNFDGEFRGPVRVRHALQQSLNIPAVAVTQGVGPHHLIAGMRRAGMNPKISGGQPGLAVALGGVGVTLTDLVALYGAMANGGQSVEIRWQSVAAPDFTPQTVIAGRSARQIADILQDVARPNGVRGDGIAFKTGTSYGHRDAWAVGFDGRHVIGVWMGRADGTPVPGAFGGDLAAPVMFAAFDRIKPRIDPLPSPAPMEANLPAHQRWFGGAEVRDDDMPRIAFPPDGAVMQDATVFAKVVEGQPPYTWLANGALIGQTRAAQIELGALGPGFSALTVIDARGRSDQAHIQLR